MRIRSVWLTRFLGWFAAVMAAALFRTYRLRAITEDPDTDCAQFTPRLYIYCLWHDEIMIPLAARYRRPVGNVAALVSRHQDGSYLTEFMRHMRIRSVRGSKNHGGDQALRELLDVTSCCHIFITPDGPRGPKHQLKDGLIFLASQSGLPIIPVVSVSSSQWTIRGNWTDLVVPKPFARVLYYAGSAIAIPPDLTREQITQWREQVQREMDRIAVLARQHLQSARIPATKPSTPPTSTPRKSAA